MSWTDASKLYNVGPFFHPVSPYLPGGSTLTLSATLESLDLSLALHASHIALLLPSMSLFAPANAVYSRYFGTSPPSRATVAVPLPGGTRIRLEVVGFDDRPSSATRSGETSEAGSGEDGAFEGLKVGARQALHVQGLSYWAPANIGPYSQAVIVRTPSPCSCSGLSRSR